MMAFILIFQAKSQGRAVSEGRDISPTRQHKIDEIWNSSTSSKNSAGSSRSSMMTKSSVSRSVDLDDLHTDGPSTKGSNMSYVITKPVYAICEKNADCAD